VAGGHAGVEKRGRERARVCRWRDDAPVAELVVDRRIERERPVPVPRVEPDRVPVFDDPLPPRAPRVVAGAGGAVLPGRLARRADDLEPGEAIDTAAAPLPRRKVGRAAGGEVRVHRLEVWPYTKSSSRPNTATSPAQTSSPPSRRTSSWWGPTWPSRLTPMKFWPNMGADPFWVKLVPVPCCRPTSISSAEPAADQNGDDWALILAPEFRRRRACSWPRWRRAARRAARPWGRECTAARTRCTTT
jgi:hypothetical protein